MSGYDVIGDIHGHADVLERLLRTMGYRETRGAYRHRQRTVIFVGDLIDRGPHQLRTLQIVRAMVEAGSAQLVLGNHEFNAVAWATPDDRGGFSRPHTEKNRGQHEVFLAAVGEGSPRHREWIEWFTSQPLWLDADGLRVVHACWDEASMRTLGSDHLTDEIVTAASGSAPFESIEIVLKGPEIDLGRAYLDKDGNRRDAARLAWWDPGATTLARAALIPGGATTPGGDPFPPLPDDPIDIGFIQEPNSATPVLYGHYWRSGPEPRIDNPRAACLDWSVAKDGPLVAYRWSGERDLTDTNLVAVH
ncbi:MAG TPA: metallophosphoesterase [Acidimicrobiales bacterium]|nr:metallophosphoesterase [Acidimicrobiales bacterium]